MKFFVVEGGEPFQGTQAIAIFSTKADAEVFKQECLNPDNAEGYGVVIIRELDLDAEVIR